MKKAINVKKGREATTNEVIKFAFIEAVKNTANELLKSRVIDLEEGVIIEITDDEIHHVEKVLNAFVAKYKECEEVVKGRVEVTRKIITD